MLTFALDAGGDEQTDYLTVAGFASSSSDWDEFSIKWKARLDRDGIAFFRAVDANGFRGPFEHWRELPDREKLRESLFADLMELIQSHVYWKVAATVVNKEFHDTQSEVRRNFVESAYSLAARTCEKYGRLWVMSDWKMCPDMKAAFIFEAGDKGQHRLRERLRKDFGHIPPNFRPKKDTRREDGSMEHGYIPLQAADWFAWETNRAVRDADAGRVDDVSQCRWPIREFVRCPYGHMGVYSPENLRDMDKMIELEDNLLAWESKIGLSKPSRH